ncbi:unnamed protein product [Schistosoma margrebowiei]|uniref:Uncharacterized protein n=1 Tax=Schistosoma margrebowiei TaxID=48269 RepID=A0A183N4W3_9TREM|nr:unnamed protein product [Schistosoma margrebowiei]
MTNCSFQDARTSCINYEAVNELDIKSMKISNTLLSRHDELQSQGQSNLRSFNSDSYSRVNMKGVSRRNYKANHKCKMKFGKCSCCAKFHSRNSCAFRNAKCLKCGKIGHIQSVCKATVHSASSSTKSCNSNLNNSDVSSDHLSLSTISKVSETGMSILGLKKLKRPKVELSFLVSKETSDTLLKKLIAMCVLSAVETDSSILWMLQGHHCSLNTQKGIQQGTGKQDEGCVDAQLRDQQAEFRKDRSCTDQTAILRIIAEQSIEWISSLYINFIDCERALDSVDRTTLWKLLRHYGVPQKTVNIIQSSYDGLHCKIMLGGQSTKSF